jgi:hypothetical protein
MQQYNEKLHPELDMRQRFGQTFGEGWHKALEAAQARR